MSVLVRSSWDGGEEPIGEIEHILIKDAGQHSGFVILFILSSPQY